MQSVCIIIPTRNEQESIVALLEQILPYGYEVVICDDSDDDTPVIAQKMGARVVKGRRLGLAQAVLDGIDATTSDCFIVMDADGQHPSLKIPEIVEQLKCHDLVVVTKHAKEAEASLSAWRKLQSNLGVWLSELVVPVPVSDPMTGFFGMRRKCLDGVPRGEYSDDGTKMIGLEGIGFKIGLELFAKARWVSHAEVPMSFARRQAGKSKGTAHSLHRHLWRLYKNSLNYTVELPKGSEEYYAFYEGSEGQRKWKQSIALLLKDITKQLQPKNLLDVGCGSSPNINLMAGQKKVGIDINAKAIEYIKEHSDATFMEGSILDIPLPDSSFDVVTCIEVLEHLYPNEIDRAMTELVRVLQHEGHLILATPNYASLRWRLIEGVQKVVQPGAWTSGHHTQFTKESLIALCQKHGLDGFRYYPIMGNMDMVLTCEKRRSTTHG